MVLPKSVVFCLSWSYSTRAGAGKGHVSTSWRKNTLSSPSQTLLNLISFYYCPYFMSYYISIMLSDWGFLIGEILKIYVFCTILWPFINQNSFLLIYRCNWVKHISSDNVWIALSEADYVSVSNWWRSYRMYKSIPIKSRPNLTRHFWKRRSRSGEWPWTVLLTTLQTPAVWQLGPMCIIPCMFSLWIWEASQHICLTISHIMFTFLKI